MTKGENKQFWRRFARLYGPVMAGSSAGMYRELCAKMAPRLSREMEVLELACGTGQLSFPLAGCVKRWEATDFSPEMVAQARRRSGPPSLRFSVQDATRLTEPEGSFDAVVIANALHIMPHPERALAEIRRVLRPGGILFAPTFVQGEAGGPGLKIRLMELAGFRTYHRWSGDELTAFLARNGFTPVRHELLRGGMAPLCYVEAKR